MIYLQSKLKAIIKEELAKIISEEPKVTRTDRKRNYRLVDQPQEEQDAYHALMKLFKDQRASDNQGWAAGAVGLFQNALLAAAGFGWKFVTGLRGMEAHEDHVVQNSYKYIKKLTKGMKAFDRILGQE